jgi:tetratricopeptide (TPR) repeat protein
MPRLGDYARTAIVVGMAALCVASVRGRAAETHKHLKETSDMHLLPPPAEVVKLSFGYRTALADVLWAHVLVSQGLRMQERRRFDNVVELIDTINELDPTFRDPYLLADALINMQVTETRREDIERTRAILERGTRNRPLDPEVWRTAGQFLAFIAPGMPFLKDAEERREWRSEGAKMLARAAELGGDSGYMGWAALSGAGILSREGNLDAAIRFLRRTLAVTEDEELREQIEKQLAALDTEAKVEADKKRQAAMATLGRQDLPYVGKTTLFVLGPPFDAAYCAGGTHENEPRCALTWKAWSEALSSKGE